MQTSITRYQSIATGRVLVGTFTAPDKNTYSKHGVRQGTKRTYHWEDTGDEATGEEGRAIELDVAIGRAVRI